MRRARRHWRRAGRAGFLLVEALSALALGALILVALLSLTGLLRRSADRAAFGVETTEITERTVDTIAQEIRRAAHRRWAIPPPPAGAKPTPQPTAPAAASNDGPDATRREPGVTGGAQSSGQDVDGAGQAAQAAPPRPFAFAGAPDRVMFALTPVQPTGLRAPVFVAYQIDGSGAVLRAEGPLTPDALGPAGVTLGPVARIDPGPERLKFAFVDRQSGGSEVVLDVWTEPMRMPAAIRIDRMDPATGALKSSLRVPLLIDGEPGCASPQGECSRVEKSSGGAGAAGLASPDGPQGAGGAQQETGR